MFRGNEENQEGHKSVDVCRDSNWTSYSDSAPSDRSVNCGKCHYFTAFSRHFLSLPYSVWSSNTYHFSVSAENNVQTIWQEIWECYRITQRYQLNHKLRIKKADYYSLCGLAVRISGYRSRRSRTDFRCYQIFWEVVGLERGPLSLVRMTEELHEWQSGSRLENRG
jgi:hypothetical protein